MKTKLYEKVEEIKKIILNDTYSFAKPLSKSKYEEFIKNHKNLDIYAKNLLALLEINPALGVKIAYSSQGDYEIFQSNDGFFNAIDSKSLKYVLKDIKEHQKYWQDRFNKDYNRYQVLYFYGVGLGDIYKFLPQSVKKLVIFEDDINLLYIAFNLNEFYKDIFSGKIAFYDSSITQADIHKLYNEDDVKSQIKLYDMLIYSDFYNDYVDNIKLINQKITDEFSKLVAANGNDATDALIGIQNFMIQLPNIAKSYKFEELINAKKDKCKNAIIVSTGPSLSKQLELLKQNQDRFYIISVDASLKILLQNDIIPDFVTSLERVECTSEFFNFDMGDKLKNTYMVVLALTHEKTASNILKNPYNNLCFCLKPVSFEIGFELHDRGYMGYGMSSANIALELALKLKCENIVFIGQDLAFGKDGKSHAKGHLYGEDEQSKRCDYSIIVKGWYEDSVPTMFVWEMFRSQLQKLMLFYQDRDYYNCTEGGAWIEGCKHIPFKEFLEKIKDNNAKQIINIQKPNDESVKNELLKIKSHIENLYKYEEKTFKLFRECFLEVAKKCEKIDKNEKSVNSNELIKLNEKIEEVKLVVESDEFCKYYMELLQPRLISFELDLAKIVAMSVNSEEDRLKKLIKWTQAHKIWLFNVYGAMEVMGENVRKYSKNLIDELDKFGINNDILKQEYERIIKAEND